MPADIILYAVIAAGLVFWLRGLLGTRHGDEQDRPNPFTSHTDPMKKQPAPELAAGAPVLPGQPEDMAAGLARNMSIENQTAEQGLQDIARADRSFELSYFLTGAQDAFIMIIEAFAEGDKDTLRGLLSDPVYKAFCGVIDERAAKNETASVEIHAIRKSEVMDAQIKDKVAYITVRFTADETSIVKDAAGQVIFGNPERITETIDVWTFGRSLRSRDPAWLVYETREDAADEVSGSTVPEADSGKE
ncbi:MAG: Tim44 domain-containing protein [Rhodospirillales bacterium]|nr:Tim44 domain-containing protein [Rhodospirillales bacterium]MCB9996995.1 Tim44 domain-containing protein [Rhodospirillales bacterium]